MQRNPLQSSQRDIRWAAVLAIVAIAALYYALPPRLTFGPNWLLPAVVALLLIPTLAARRSGRTRMNFVFGMILSGTVTASMIWSLAILIAGLPAKRESPEELLRSAVALWCSNVLVFASWYWRLDAGGLHRREMRESHTQGDFLFPQMMMPDSIAEQNWKPGFVDYLFLAFNTSTAFSPTDVPVLSRWAKVLMMTQSCISLSTLAILAARAINIL